MKRYLLLMYNREQRMPKNPTKAQIEAGVKPWTDWLAPLTRKGAVESVAPVARDGKAVTRSSTKAYRARSIDLGGYMVIKARNMAEAVRIAKSSPHAKTRMGPTTVRECVEM